MEHQNKMKKIADLPAIKNIDTINSAMKFMNDLHFESIKPGISKFEQLSEITNNVEISNLTGLTNLDNWQILNLKSSIFETMGKGIVDIIEKTNNTFASLYTESLQKIFISVGQNVVNVMNSSAMNWLMSFDFTSIINSIARNLEIDFSFIDAYKQFNERYLQAMYECHWFPYVGWTIGISLMLDVSEVLASSRGVSKRCEKRIDKIVLSYYTSKEIKNIKRNWRNSNLEPHIKKILGQAIEAHLRGEYVLTISCLSSMWETLIYYRAGITRPLKQKETKEKLKMLTEENGLDDIFSDFYDNLILSHINTPEEVMEGVPNRNGSLHGKYKKYPNKKASLNAILITDFIISLEPKKECEVIQNG